MNNWHFNVNKPYFDKDNFKSYLAETYKGFDGTDGLFLRNVIDNIVWYANNHKDASRDQLCDFLADLLNDIVEFGEIAMFAPDKMLTDFGREQKWDTICEAIKAEQLDTMDFTSEERDYIANVLWEQTSRRGE